MLDQGEIAHRPPLAASGIGGNVKEGLAPNIAMFVALAGLCGAATAALDTWLGQTLPSRQTAGIVFGLLVVSVASITLLLLAQVLFLDPAEGMSSYAGPLVTLAAIATVIGWKRDFTGEEKPGDGWKPLRVMSVRGIAGAAVAGMIDLIVEANAVL